MSGSRTEVSGSSLCRSSSKQIVAPTVIGSAVTLALLLASRACLAGPPFFTDDPVPVEAGHWEINNFSAATFAAKAGVGEIPGIDANYGASENVQLHLMVALNFVETAGINTPIGLGDTEVGVKYRFIPATEKDWWPQVAFYPFFDFPTGNAELGLGTGRAHEFFPIWVQKDFGKWTAYGGAGYWNNPGPDNKNFWFIGGVLQYQLTDELAFGGEIFHQTQSSTADINSPGFPLGTKDTTGFNFGGSYNFNKTYHLLFSFGRGLQNASTNNVFSYYLALQVTY